MDPELEVRHNLFIQSKSKKVKEDFYTEGQALLWRSCPLCTAVYSAERTEEVWPERLRCSYKRAETIA
jgi:hypothetical protein